MAFVTNVLLLVIKNACTEQCENLLGELIYLHVILHVCRLRPSDLPRTMTMKCTLVPFNWPFCVKNTRWLVITFYIIKHGPVE